MASAVSISNAALAEIGADAIQSLSETSVSARECSRVFDSVVLDLLERHDWGFLIRRLPGVAVTNARPGEWNGAYAKPAEAARVLRVLPANDASYPEWDRYSSPLWDAFGPIPFVEVAGVIYANVSDAVLEIALATAEVSAFPSLFRRAVELELAARIAMPIKKDRALKGDMIKQAEVALMRAMAEDNNRHPVRSTDYVSEAEIARAGIETGVAI